MTHVLFDVEPAQAIDGQSRDAVEAALTWSLAQGMGFRAGDHLMRQVPFSLTPAVVSQETWNRLIQVVSAMGRLIHGVSQDCQFLRQTIAPAAEGDPFFGGLLRMYDRIHRGQRPYLPMPVLMMRTDFMDDRELGPQVVEFNGIAAGMGPFGQRTHQLHHYLRRAWPQVYRRWTPAHRGPLVDNPAIERLSGAIASAAGAIREEFGESGAPVMLMVVQQEEDNVFDQKLLEMALHRLGVVTVRRSFRQLYGALSSGPGQRLLLDGVGGVDFVYLRAGYHYRDYVANDILDQPCCEALAKTRILIEAHRVAINASVAQQLASSKRVQMVLGGMSPAELTRFGVSLAEASEIAGMLAALYPLNAASLARVEQSGVEHWVLKNQGEGGGHCVFGASIPSTLATLEASDYPAWLLMRRLRPAPRGRATLVVRDGQARVVSDLVSELGLFSVHIDGREAFGDQGYAGYLVRSKPAGVAEGGVHSGLGVLDSLALA